MTKPTHLTIVPPLAPDARRAVIERIKAAPRPEGVLQCAHCGGRQTMTMRSGDRIEGGRLVPGTVLEKCICPHCWKQGVIVDLLPDRPREVKQPKPRRTKPKLIK